MTQPATPESSEEPRNLGADIREFFHIIGGFSGVRGGEIEEPERPVPENPAELIDEHPLDVRDVEPLSNPVFVDGVQAAIRASYVEHRPVMLHHVAAAALTEDLEPVVERHDIWVSCSPEEKAWLEERGCRLRVEAIDKDLPPDLSREAHRQLAGKRESLEREVIFEAGSLHAGPIVVDGGLTARVESSRVVGVVKTTQKRYLSDESIIYKLPHGWRSPRFKISQHGAEVYSAYLRLVDATNKPWDFGLVRIEAWDPVIIDSAAALCLLHAQAPGDDSRWDCHIAGVANVERFLRARRPDVFSLAE